MHSEQSAGTHGGRAGRRRRCDAIVALAFLLPWWAACRDEPPGQSYYERTIAPILTASCAGNTAGCHAASPDDPFAFAAGNLDVTSYQNLLKRRDLLKSFGPYPVPLLLIKAVGATDELGFTYRGTYRPLEVQHAGGAIFSVGSDAYLTLLTWLENGATETGLPPPPVTARGRGACSTFVPEEFVADPILTQPTFSEFRNQVQPVLRGCAAGSCHGAPQADFYVTCGDDERQLAFNFSQAWGFVDTDVANSQILQLPLAVSAGGLFHTGGDHFFSRNDAGYLAIARWAEQVGPRSFGVDDPGAAFFAERVQPLLVARGCAFEACHSPAAANDFKLRSGSQGFFSAIALERNYKLLRDEFMALEVPDARRGRAVAKNVLPVFGGIAHRGGPLFETAGSGGSDPQNCPQPFAPATASAFCVMQEWQRIERSALIASGQALPLAPGNTVRLVYVERQATHLAPLLAFDTYQAGSDLKVVTATIGPDGALSVTGTPTSLLDGCPGASNRAAVDVTGPDVDRSGTTVVFSMRLAADQPRSLYTVGVDGAGCTPVSPPRSGSGASAGHDFDPAWSPDGEWIVFASSRGGPEGPTLSRRLLLPQSDLWRMRRTGDGLERMTYLTNSELGPQFMREGRVIMTTEKVSAGFYQLAGRRINWDLTDYHPLLAQRASSPFAAAADPWEMRPSIGYAQATEIREGHDGNFLMVLSDAGSPASAGALALFNRSVGTFELGRGDPGFLRSVSVVGAEASGRLGQLADGAYRSPFPLPDGQIMASFAPLAGDLAAASALDFDLYAVDARSGRRSLLLAGAGQQVEAVLAVPYPARQLYRNRRQLVFGGRADEAAAGGRDAAVVHFPDARLLFTLLTANLRRGRPVDLLQRATHLAFYREQPAPPGTTAGNAGDIFESRQLLGRVTLRDDGSAKVRVPAGQGLIIELQDGDGNAVLTMGEEHQFGPGEIISMGIARPLFDAVCGGCHGSISGRELDVTVTPDALTGASESLSRDVEPSTL
jgi:hypothetical protein